MDKGIRPCLTVSNNWIGCPYPGSETLCAATEKEVNGKALWLACLLAPGIHKVPEGYYPPKPKVQRVIEAARQSETERRRKHTRALTVQKAVSKREPKQAPLPKALRMKQYINGKWTVRVFQNGAWIDDPDRQNLESTAG